MNPRQVTTLDSYRVSIARRSTILVPFLLFDCFGFSAGTAPTLSGEDAILFPVPGDVVLGETQSGFGDTPRLSEVIAEAGMIRRLVSFKKNLSAAQGI